MKKIVCSGLLLSSTLLFAQADSVVTEVKAEEISPWTKKGNFSLLLSQSSFSNWQAGGENNFAANLGINYDFNYKKNDITWDNKIIAEYGLVQTKNAEFAKKTNDRLEFNSLFGKTVSKTNSHWYYSAFANFRTQFATGYTYGKDAQGKETRSKYTEFFSPAYLSFGPGLLWKQSDNLKVNLAPATSKITFINNKFRNEIGLADANYFGVDPGKSIRYELGFNASAYYKFNLMRNVSVENILNLYSNYLDKPQNVDIDYTLNVAMTINKYLSTNLIFQTIYDDNAFRGFQTRQVLGVGVNFGF